MRKNATAVIQAFQLSKATRDYRNAIWTDGQAIYSYAMKIAERLPDGSIWIVAYSEAPSFTTRSHVRACQFLLQAEPIVVVAEERLADDRREERCG